MNRRSVRLEFSVWLALLAAAIIGCARPVEKPAAKVEPLAEIELGLLVVDDPAMAAAIGELRAEWKARTGATVVLSESTTAELLAGEGLKAGVDAVIYPADLLGTLAEKKWIAPLSEESLANRELDWPDTFELLQVADTRWGGVPHAVPFGSPVLTCYYRTDVLERAHRRPPRTWQEYHELAALLKQPENVPEGVSPESWAGTIEPLAPGWAARVLLARAAPYAKHRDHYSTLFKIDTMEPLIAGAGFVRALEELAADAKLGPANVLELDPAAVRRQFMAGHAALALSWPTHADKQENAETKVPAFGFAELPGSDKVYNFAAQSWEARTSDQSLHTTLLGLAGRFGSVNLQASHPDQALKLLAWLSGREWGAKVSAASPATTLYRQSQLRAPQPWLAAGVDTQVAQQYGSTVKDALRRERYLIVPRIPGQEKYLAALDKAVEQAVRGEKSPTDALAEVAAAWSAITTELGVDQQRTAYRNSLGLEP